ncbi:MAG: hypothetical protein ABI596_17155 [Pyrinomonadaceae bacterium]
MKADDPLPILISNLADLTRMSAWLEESYNRCRLIDAGQVHSAEHAEAVEAFTSRFARTIDLLANKVLRALDLVELEPSGSLLDVLNRAEARALVDSSERLREMKNLRNTAHDYVGEKLPETFAACVEFAPQLLAVAKRVQDYCTRFRNR